MTGLANVWTIARKELRGYFGSPVAVIFLATFLAVTLFTVFWYEKFFARGIADLRPMFDWLPVLLILLVGALAMRLWSEERKLGTLEILMTLPVPRWQLVAGKFVAGMLLIALALALTLGLPITVSQMGDLDFGPVIGGYFAALLLAAAYLAIGMCVSAVTGDQIVALVGTVVACALLYLPGTAPIADLAGGDGELLRKLGTGSRFASVARGVLDVRDLVYYLGLIAVFLGLNVLLLGRLSWSAGSRARARHRSTTLAIALIAANAVVLNLWMSQITRARIDLTQHGEYSLSDTTRRLVGSLPEPLLIRGYLSEKTHPALAPLVPQIRDLLEEYRIAGGGRVRVELVDPSGDDAAIKEARERYEISPTPLRFASRLEKSVINAYFTVLVEYGDQHEVLGLDELVEVTVLDVGELDIRLEKLEYDLTSTIKKVVTGFQSVEAMFATLPGTVELIAYITPDSLPPSLAKSEALIDAAAGKLVERSGGKLVYSKVAPKTEAEIEQIFRRYGVRPIVDPFTRQFAYYELVMKVGERAVRIQPPQDLTEATLEASLSEALERAAPGFTTVVGMWVPPTPPPQPPMMEGMPPQRRPPPQKFDDLRGALGGIYEVRDVDLAGPVPDDIAVLVLAGPAALGADAVAAVDQFVMRGGSLVVLGGRYRLAPSRRGLAVEAVTTGLEAMLTRWGITLGDELVLDPAGEKIAIPQVRDLGDGTQTQELVHIAYPYFARVDGDRVARGTVITAGVPGAVLHLVTPVTVAAKLGDEPRTVQSILRSTSAAWLATTLADPDLKTYPGVGFGKPADLPAEKVGSKVLAVAIIGGFPSSVAEDAAAGAGSAAAGPGSAGAGAVSAGAVADRKLVHSPPDTRIVVFGSSAFVSDDLLGLSQQLGSDLARSNLQLVHNAVDWAVADTDLLGIRAGSSASRTLTVDDAARGRWEAINYGLALVGLALVIFVSAMRRRRITPIALPEEVTP